MLFIEAFIASHLVHIPVVSRDPERRRPPAGHCDVHSFDAKEFYNLFQKSDVTAGTDATHYLSPHRLQEIGVVLGEHASMNLVSTKRINT